MRKELVGAAAAALAVLFVVVPQPKAHADYFAYPCNYPFQGVGGSLSMVVTAGGQYCDGPTEINWSHYHCESGGAHVPVGGIGLAPVGPINLGAIGGGGIGGDLEGCHFLCPDGSKAPFPNPPAAWIKHLVLEPKNNDCVGHMGVRGDTSAPLPNQLPGNIEPGQDAPDGVAVPKAPGDTPQGQENPPALPGIPPPQPQVAPGVDTAPMPSGHPVTPDAGEGSPLTPGSPMQLP
jgi:hypothetical protein